MIVVSEKDFLEVIPNSLIADYDRDIIVNLYQPIIGFAATALYFTFWSETNIKNTTSILTHEGLLARLQMSMGNFVEARKALEGIGLLKTYRSKEKKCNFYTYELYAPRDPKDFFNDVLTYGLFKKSLGETIANRVKNRYLAIKSIKGEDISEEFKDVYHPDFSNPAFFSAIKGETGMISRLSGVPVYSFSYEKLFESFPDFCPVSERDFSSLELKEIERISALNGINEEKAASFIVDCYSSDKKVGKRVDLDKFAKEAMEDINFRLLRKQKNNPKEPHLMTSETEIATKINMMESSSPKEYLTYLQNGTQPAISELKLINDISSHFVLPNGVINALVDYVLNVNKNVLSRSYCEKVAASLKREGIDNAYDAMNYFNLIAKNRKETKVKKETSNEVEIKVEKEVKQESKEDDSSWDSMFDDVQGDTDGEN